jgi:cellulose synthase/poly-beta-1,6-N-acetylglucosamine synthase-like glycosyltransferase
MQDMEFVGFSSYVQVARDRIGSSGLGGNGQFTRLQALQELGEDPWDSKSLTEDLDLGLRLVEAGWVTRFTNKVFVHQQGLESWRPLLKQRTRWIQGHYQSWGHIPRILKSQKVKFWTKVDLTTYLLLVTSVVLIAFNLVVGLLGTFGLITTQNNFLAQIPFGFWYTLINYVLLLGPISIFAYVYQKHSDNPLKWWELPGFCLLFTLYSYVWAIVTLRAWTRMILGKNNWVKTTRVADEVTLGKI